MPLPTMQLVRGLVQEAIDAGHTGVDFAALIEVEAARAGLDMAADPSRSRTAWAPPRRRPLGVRPLTCTGEELGLCNRLQSVLQAARHRAGRLPDGRGVVVRVAPHKVSLAMAVAALAVTAACGGGSGGGSSSGELASRSWSASRSRSRATSPTPATRPSSATSSGPTRSTSRAASSGARSQLKIVDDASSPNQVVTNYQTLITRDKVDLVFGPFSTLLTAPAARVASRYGYAFPEPAGGGPLVFQEKLGNVFFVQPAPVVNCGDPFVKLHPVAARPASGRRPPPTPSSTTRSPRRSPSAPACSSRPPGSRPSSRQSTRPRRPT